mmetsp:Transcript_2528/g.5397  ORF Transcript_2528/g.5397 Transcript_2528/m.5397 type:complete len:237 (+) Transcript_2528:171-881(+)
MNILAKGTIGWYYLEQTSSTSLGVMVESEFLSKASARASQTSVSSAVALSSSKKETSSLMKPSLVSFSPGYSSSMSFIPASTKAQSWASVLVLTLPRADVSEDAKGESEKKGSAQKSPLTASGERMRWSAPFRVVSTPEERSGVLRLESLALAEEPLEPKRRLGSPLWLLLLLPLPPLWLPQPPPLPPLPHVGEELGTELGASLSHSSGDSFSEAFRWRSIVLFEMSPSEVLGLLL